MQNIDFTKADLDQCIELEHQGARPADYLVKSPCYPSPTPASKSR